MHLLISGKGLKKHHEDGPTQDRQESPETNRMRKTYSDTGAEGRDPDPVLRKREVGPEAAGKAGGRTYRG